jgi:hypothetical protein
VRARSDPAIQRGSDLRVCGLKRNIAQHVFQLGPRAGQIVLLEPREMGIEVVIPAVEQLALQRQQIGRIIADRVV